MRLSLDAVRFIVFVLAYTAIAFPRFPGLRLTRPAAAFAGAVAMVVIGRLPAAQAYAAIDADVIAFLLGILIVATYLDLGGFFEWAAAHITTQIRSPTVLLGAVVVFAGILSAFFMNDTICLVLTPLIITVVRALGLPALPFVLAVAMASNVGSATAITGNPQNMLVGITSGIGYGEFLAALALPSLGALTIVFGVLALVFRRELKQPPAIPAAQLSDVTEHIAFDRQVVTLALVVFAAMLAGWLAHLSLPLVSVGGAAVLLVLARRDTSQVLRRVDWPLLLFFASLFVIVRGVRDVPVMHALTTTTAHLLSTPLVANSPWRTASLVSAAVALLSNLVSNVPAVLLWRPFVPALPHPTSIWLIIAMSSTFAGNLSILGSMANLIVLERAEAKRVTVTFGQYLRVGVPVTLLTLAWGIATLVATR